MKIVKTNLSILTFIITLIFRGCQFECPECNSPPPIFTFDLVNKSSGESVFKDDISQQYNLRIRDFAKNEDIDFELIPSDTLNLIQISSIGWVTEIVEYQFRWSNKNIFRLYVDSERVSEDCCEFTRTNEIRIDSADYEQDHFHGFYKVFIEP